MGFFSKIKDSLKKTRENITSKFDQIIKSFTKVDEELFEELEEMLIISDIGALTANKICNSLRQKVKSEGIQNPSEIKDTLKQILIEILEADNNLNVNTKPSIILMIGVNGVGKTTTIGKIALNYVNEGKKVLLAAADTFRAAAVEQLEIWADRVRCDIIKHKEGADPAAVVFDAISAAKARNVDLIICDTAGRLHNKKNLMNELSKIGRIIDRELPDANKEYLLVLDATTGQNGLNQAIEFKNMVGITGIVLTKLDGTAKGGIIVSIKDQLNVPIKFIGIGEGEKDLQIFNAKEFVDALFSEKDENN